MWARPVERERERKDKEEEDNRADRDIRDSGKSRCEPASPVIHRLRLNARYRGFGGQRYRDERTPTGVAVLVIVVGLTLTSLGGFVAMPGASASGGGQVYVPPYNTSPLNLTNYTASGGSQCSLAPPACGAEFQPDGGNITSSWESETATGVAYNTQNATVGEWVRKQSGVGPYFATGQVMARFSIQTQIQLSAGTHTITEDWLLQGEAHLRVWGVSSVGGVLTAYYAMNFGVKLQPAGGLSVSYLNAYSSAQLQCTAPCNQSVYYPLSGPVSPSFSVGVPVSGLYTISAFVTWNSTARETGIGDATASSCLNMGNGPWCAPGNPLPAGWAELQSITVT